MIQLQMRFWFSILFSISFVFLHDYAQNIPPGPEPIFVTKFVTLKIWNMQKL